MFLVDSGCHSLYRDLSCTTRGPAQGLLGIHELITLSLTFTVELPMFQPALIISGSLNCQGREWAHPKG